VILGLVIEQIRVGLIGQGVFTGFGDGAGIEIIVYETAGTRIVDLAKQLFVVGNRAVEAGHEQLLCFRGGNLERQSSEWADFGDEAKEECDELGPERRLTVFFFPILLVAGARQVVEEFLFGDSGDVFLNITFLGIPGGFGHFGNDLADGAAIGSERKIVICENGFHVEAVGFAKRAHKQIFRHLEADKVAVRIGGVTAFGDLHDVETEFRLEMFDRRLIVGDVVAEFGFQLWVKNRDSVIGGDAVAVVVGCVMGESAQGKSVFVKRRGIAEKLLDEIAGANVMDEIAEQMAAERIVAQVLDD
jgi:hypothetical protein